MSASELGYRFCPACLSKVEQFAPGPNGRPDASCPHCQSLERHRFLALVLEGLGPAIAAARVVLDVGPTTLTTKLLERLAPERRVRIDLDPDADNRLVDVQASLTHLPLPDASVDLALCYHVLEHIPDDRRAMSELARVLTPAGLALVQVPWRPEQVTDEDPSAPLEERVRRFGQADHVRCYGADFEDRLRAAGLDLLRFTPREVAGDVVADLLRLTPDEPVWLVRRADGRSRTRVGARPDLRMTAMAALAETADQLAREVKAAEARASAAGKRAARWEREYPRLHGRLPVRVLVTLAKRFGPVRRSLNRGKPAFRRWSSTASSSTTLPCDPPGPGS